MECDMTCSWWCGPLGGREGVGAVRLSNFGLSRLVLPYLLSHNTINSASRTLFTVSVEQPRWVGAESRGWFPSSLNPFSYG